MIAECKKILTGIVKMLESMAVELVEDPKLESEVNDKSWLRTKVVAELASLQ